MRFRLLMFALFSLALIRCTLAPPASAVEIMASAVMGQPDQPYGVATIEIPLAVPLIGEEPQPLEITAGGRVLFPVPDDVAVRITPPSERPVPRAGNGRLLGRIGNLIREITNKDDPKTQIVARRVMFLFSGTTPLKVTLGDGVSELGTYELVPRSDPIGFRDSLLGWWTAYASGAKKQIDDGDYPPWVETYLVAMLSGRTGNGLPEWFLEERESDDPLWSTLKYLAGAEETQREIFRRTAAGLTDENLPQNANVPVASAPLPAGPLWQNAALPPVDETVATEPMASRVPPECFYLRFGTFQNYLWLLDLTTEYGGDLGRMITLRGTASNSTKGFEEQLGVQINQLTRMLGPTVIEDQAVIGRDMFTASGATMGVLMKSTNAFLLRSSMNNDRSKRARENSSISLKQVKVGDHEVSFMSSPDNRTRSYMAEDQGFFLVTNSKSLVKRFFEVGASGQSLAATDSFRLSRSLVPLEREDTIFAYFPPEMLQGLVSPKYLIELRRRANADSDVSLVHLARLAAASEGIQSASNGPLGVDELIRNGFLPISFGNRSDGSGIVSVGDQVIDTMRGARGAFLPIADVEIDSVTPAEFNWYSKIADEYSNRFPQMDPIVVALRRDEIPGDSSLERISIHAEIAPLTPEKYGKWAKQLGPPTTVVVRPAPDDIVSLQAHVASEQIGPPTHLFAGIKDTFPPAPEEFDGLLKAYRSLQQLPSYLGAWPQPGALDRLPLGLGRGRPIGPGMSKLLGGIYRYTGGGFSVLSFQQEVLNASLPYLEAKEVDQPATARGQIGSLLGSQLEGWVNNQLYQRAVRSSEAGSEFLNLLGRQLHVKPDAALETAERVLGVPLQCSLGGQYQYDAASHRWISSAWKGASPNPLPPADYVAPLLNWFRGGEFTMTQYADRLVADAVVTLSRQ